VALVNISVFYINKLNFCTKFTLNLKIMQNNDKTYPYVLNKRYSKLLKNYSHPIFLNKPTNDNN
jgi:hypothetical protein